MSEFRCQRSVDWLLTHLLHAHRHCLAASLRLLLGHLSCSSQQHWSRELPLFSHMLTAYLTTGDFVRLTNRSPFPSLMSFEHFIAIWPAALEPQREWSMMETPYKKKINQTHFNSNIVREKTALRIRDAKDNTYDTEGRWWTYIMSFYVGKNDSPFHFSPSVITRPLTPLPFASLSSLFLFQHCASSSLRVWSVWWAAVWLQVNKS